MIFLPEEELEVAEPELLLPLLLLVLLPLEEEG
jgi:hypothetical protein